ncbi:MAG: hypothetical protein AABX54_02955 [Nanoarchaeota archaeon]
MLAIKGLVLFLVRGSHISHYCLKFALTDFLEQYKEEQRKLTQRDYKETERIRQNPYLLTKSYLFNKIEPFLLPFYERRRHN